MHQLYMHLMLFHQQNQLTEMYTFMKTTAFNISTHELADTQLTIGCIVKIAVPSYHVRPSYASVLKWNPGSTTDMELQGHIWLLKVNVFQKSPYSNISNTGNDCIGKKLLALEIHLNSPNRLCFRIDQPDHNNRPTTYTTGYMVSILPRAKLIAAHINLSCFHDTYFHLL